MPKVKSTSSPKPSNDIRPALNPENAEAQCVSLAMNLVRQRLIDGTASAQEVTHFLKLGSREAQLKTEILELEKDLTVAKTEKLNSEKRTEEMYANAIKSMRTYSGNGDPDEYDY